MNPATARELATIANHTGDQLAAARNRLTEELSAMIVENDHPRSIDATVLTVGLVEVAMHLSFAISRALAATYDR